MKNKILISFFTVILTVSLLCFNSFAATENFTDVISLSYVNIYGLTVGEDYERSITSGEDFEQSKAYAINQGAEMINRFYCRFVFKTPSITAATEGATANLGSASSPFYSGYYLNAKLKFKLYCDFRNGSEPDIQYIVPKIRTSSAIGDWQLDKLVTCGKAEYTDFKQDSSGNWYTDCTVDISYKNTGKTIDNYSCQFAIYVKANSYHNFFASVYTYTPFVLDYYYGDGTEPNAPIYKDYSDTVGTELDNLKEQEDALLNDTSQGREDTISLFQNFGETLAMFSVPLLALKGLFDYLIADTVFEGILLISLTLGLLSFVFNIFPSIQARQHRERNAEAQRTKNAQYNAMMNRLDKQGKGGS